MIEQESFLARLLAELALVRASQLIEPTRQSKHRNQRHGMKAKQVARRRAQEKNRRKVNRGRR